TQSTPSPIYTIPVVFHIIHEYGPEDISDDQVMDALAILNRDYRKQNADTSVIVSQFQSLASDVGFQFKLARKDPSGNCTTGIDRIASPETYIGDDGSKLNPWPRSKYLNIWVCQTITTYDQSGNPVHTAAAYAYLPGTAPSSGVDGVIVRSDYVGSIGTGSALTSRTLTHEIGHFFNLKHTWGSSNAPGVACGDDNVGDTPQTKGWTTCNLTNNDVCNVNVVENVQNYMEYSYCSRMFTAGQVTRMRTAITANAGSRNSLWTTATLTATGVNTNPTCAPIADFISNTQFVCAGSNVSFSWMSTGGHPTSWSWTFPGGTPSASTDSFPVITYNTPGTYNVTMVVSNGAGNNSLTRTAYIHVGSSTATYSNWQYSESFESISSLPSTDWSVVNNGGNTWTSVTGPNYTGVKSVMITNGTSESGQTDELIGPSVDLTVIPSPVFTFRVAYAQRTSADADKLQMYVSTNCGQTWAIRYNKSGGVLKTASPTTSSYVPQWTDWRLETVSIAPYASSTNLLFKFVFVSDGGNNVYIDDININGASGVEEYENAYGLFVFPNPMKEESTVSFTLQEKQNVKLSLVDVLGRTVQNVFSGPLPEGEHQLNIQKQNVEAGIYFVRLEAGGQTVNRKIIIN
ncbi:MAG TPA: M43 family zinc metalloprotease, partial [Bacteroidia bacterium]